MSCRWTLTGMGDPARGKSCVDTGEGRAVVPGAAVSSAVGRSWRRCGDGTFVPQQAYLCSPYLLMFLQRVYRDTTYIRSTKHQAHNSRLPSACVISPLHYDESTCAQCHNSFRIGTWYTRTLFVLPRSRKSLQTTYSTTQSTTLALDSATLTIPGLLRPQL